MPAKSAAYEKGIREGRAMAARSRNPEASEPKEEEEEMDMAASHSRKRSAKGAKNTKPAKDGGTYGKKPMDAECGCGRKGKCDGNCGSMRKRSDSLTPLEYLDACELGIQDRSTTYIRARLDAAERLDLKCGKGAISEGEKCTKGAAQKVQPKQARGGSRVRGLKTAAKIAGAAALIGGAAYMQQTAKRNTDLRRALDPAARMKAGAPAPSRKTQLAAVMKAREAAWRKAKRRGDSIYATGFSPEPGSLAL